MKSFLSLRTFWLSLFLFPSTLAFANPDFSDISVQSNNVNSNIAKIGNILSFDLTLNVPDTSNGGTVTFDIGTAVGLTASFPVSGGALLTHSANYTVLAGQNGSVSISNIVFSNQVPENLINPPAFSHVPAVNVLVDTSNPTIAENVAVTTPTSDNTPDYIFSSDEAGLIMYGGSCMSATINAVVGNNSITFNALADGSYSNCTISIMDSAGNISNQINVSTFDIDATGPVIAEITAIATSTNDTTPNYVFSSNEAGTIAYGGSCASASVNAVIGNNSITLNALANGTYSNCTIVVSDALGNLSNQITLTAFEVDTNAPSIGETTPVTSPTNDNTPDYVFTSDEAGAITYGGSCASATVNSVVGNNTISMNQLADGSYSNCTILVTDDAGNISNQINISTFEIDATGPVISEVTAITTPTNDTTPDYVFASDEAGTIAYGGSCASASVNAVIGNNTITLNALGEGNYSNCTISVTDGLGNVSNQITLTAFEVDTNAPSISETTGVITPTSDNTPDYVFSSDEAGSLSYGGSCSSASVNAVNGSNTITLNALADGTYSNCTIVVSDGAGNLSNQINVSAFEIDTTGPTIAEVTAIATSTNDTTPDYVFSSDEAGVISYGGSCASASVNAVIGNNSITLNALADASYSDCTILITDITGNISNQITLSAFEIDTKNPIISEASAVTNPTNDNTPDFVFISDEVGAITYGGSCASASVNAVIGNNSITLNNLVEGTYSNCTVSVTDEAGNISNQITLSAFEIDNTSPVIAEFTAVTTPTNDNTPDSVFTSDEAGTITYGGSCASFTVNAVVGNNSITLDALADGIYADCTIMVTDLAGNDSNQITLTTFEVDTTNPVYSSTSVTSDNGYDSSYAKPGSQLTFTVGLTTPDIIASGQVDFSIGSTTGLSANIVIDGTRKANHSATYTILAGQDGAISITGITLVDQVGLPLQGFVSPQVPNPTVMIDSTFPLLSSTSVTGNGAPNHTNYLNAGKNATYSVTFSEPINTSAITSASTAQNISTLSQDFDIAGNLLNDQLIFTVLNGDNGTIVPQNIDFTITDRAGNQTTINSLGVITGGVIFSDTITPSLSSIHIESNNSDTTRAKTNDKITVTFTSDEVIENVSATIFGEVATITNIAGNDWNAELMTNGDEADGVVPFMLNFIDQAGNAGVTVSATTDTSQVIFDRTNPVINDATMASSNTFLADTPTFYAKNNETITLTFDSSEKIKTPTGTILGKNATFVNLSGDFQNWTATITTANTDAEGTIPFLINIFDLTGNGDGVSNPLVTISATTNGSSVIFDRTAPDIPTSVLDRKGAITPNFKHRFNADFSWSGHQDLDQTDSFAGSGIYQFLVRLNNVSASYDETTVKLVNETSHDFFSQKVLPPNDDDYLLFIDVVDKAGNHSLETQVYNQKYTIGLLGKAVDEAGNPIANATVQVVAEFGDTCDTGTDICSDSTDANGDFAIVLQKDRDYIVSYFDRKHYLEKDTIHIAQDDFTRNATLVPITARKQYQSGEQIVQLLAQQTETNNEVINSLIFIRSLSGQITTATVDGGFSITSFGRILSVTSNNPDVLITDDGNNTFTVKNAGNIAHESTKDDFGVATTISDPSYSTDVSFASGQSRMGVIAFPSSGKAALGQAGRKREELLSHGKIWTEEESKAFTKKFNEGTESDVKFYINRNGYAVFAGYKSGRRALDQYEKRLQNQVIYRGKKTRNTRYEKVSVTQKTKTIRTNIRSTLSLAEKNKEMKEKYQHQYEEGKSHRGKPQAGYRKLRTSEAHKSVSLKKKYDAQKVNKFERKRVTSATKSRLAVKNLDTIKLRVGGKSVSMSKFFPN